MDTRNDKPILAFDCATPAASVALAVGGKIYTRAVEPGKQAALLVPAIESLMREQNVAYADLGWLVSTVGPGSFTGLRIALATLHGFALAHAIGVKTTTSLQAVAWDITNAAPFSIALNAGKGEVFTQHFSADGLPTSDIALVDPQTILHEPHCYSNVHAVDHARYVAGPQAATLCRMAAHLPQTALADAMPLYIRAPDAKIPANLPWLQTT